MKLTRTEYHDEMVGLKRQYFPYKLEVKCKKCGGIISKDFGTEYISCPCYGFKETIIMWCPNCDEEEEIYLIPHLYLEIAGGQK